MRAFKPFGSLSEQMRHTFITCRPSLTPSRAFTNVAVKIHRPPLRPLSRKTPCRLTLTQQFLQEPRKIASARYYSSEPPTRTPALSQTSPEPLEVTPPTYKLVFTCKLCMDRSSHHVSKQGYHHGAVLITCPSCKARHVISDHLGIFSDKKITIEELMEQNGERVKKGTLGVDGDIEFWAEDDETARTSSVGAAHTAQS